MKRYLHKAWNAVKPVFANPRSRVVCFIVLFIVLGVTALFIARATLPNSSFEGESGVKNGTASCSNTANASNNDCAQFGGGGGSGQPAATALTIVGTDSVASNAVCIDNSAAVGTSKVTACIQVNPSNSSQARGGTYDITQKKFVPATGWNNLPDIMAAGKISSQTCDGTNHTFWALGPLNTTYYGEEVTGATITFGTMNSSNVCNTSGGGREVTAQWAKPAIYCSNPDQAETTIQGILNDITNNKSEICVDPSGSFVFAAGSDLIKPKAGMKIIGKSPLKRPVFDSSAKLISSGQTGSFASGGAGVVLANLIVTGAKAPDDAVHNHTCSSCGNGVNGGRGIIVYNVKMFNNQETGFHFADSTAVGSNNLYDVENSELSQNGQHGPDEYWSSGGSKTINGGLFKNNVIMNNIGGGLWCDGNDTQAGHSKCHGGAWQVYDNYIAGNTSNGVHYEIVFKSDYNPTPTNPWDGSQPWADIRNNVLNCNNAGAKGRADLSIFGAYALASNNIFDNRNDSDISPASARCTNPQHEAVFVYNDARAKPGYYTHDIRVQNNYYLSSDRIDCADAKKQTDLSPTIICSPNSAF